jgi:hypothetical protein
MENINSYLTPLQSGSTLTISFIHYEFHIRRRESEENDSPLATIFRGLFENRKPTMREVIIGMEHGNRRHAEPSSTELSQQRRQNLKSVRVEQWPVMQYVDQYRQIKNNTLKRKLVNPSTNARVSPKTGLNLMP